MRTGRVGVTYNPKYGISSRHFRIFQDVAALRQVVLLVRGGKPAAIQWIDRGYPAKPMFLKAKVDRTLGLLKLDGPGDPSLPAAQHHLCYVVDLDATGKLIAHSPEHPTRKSVSLDLTKAPWREFAGRLSVLKGVVLEESSLLPYTSDYDLGAVLVVGAGLKVATDHVPPVNYQFKFQKNNTSALVDSIAAELNRRMTEPNANRRTAPRVMHGANAQYDGNPANRDNEVILVFWHDHRVERFVAPTQAASATMMREIWQEMASG